MKTGKNITCRFAKLDDEKKLVYGVVLVPEVEDLQEDIISAEEVEKAAHGFMAKYRTAGEMHKTEAPAIPVESYIAPMTLDLGGEEPIAKGSWVIVMKVLDDVFWTEKIKSGEYAGFSIGGYSYREKI
jgi:Putative phage serine protease XkdF